MIIENGIAFNRRREAEERSAAKAATNRVVGDVHLAMADRYADRAWGLEKTQQREPSRRHAGRA